jgi:protein-tyrosine phosphatase
MLLHCTQGKDRTGLIVALVLFLLGVPIEIIADEYNLSEVELYEERDERLREIREIGLTEEFANAPREYIFTISDHIQQKYGGVPAYLTHIGVSEETQEQLIRTLQSS